MDMTLDSYGRWSVTLADGSLLRLTEARDGGLVVSAQDGRLVVRPNASNEVVIRVEGHFQDSRKLAAQARVQEFLRQRGQMSQQHPTEVYAVASDPEAEAAPLLVADLKLLAGEP